MAELTKKMFFNRPSPKINLWFGVFLIGSALGLVIPFYSANAQIAPDLIFSNIPVVNSIYALFKGAQWVGDTVGPTVSALPGQIAEMIFSTLFKIILSFGALFVAT